MLMNNDSKLIFEAFLNQSKKYGLFQDLQKFCKLSNIIFTYKVTNTESSSDLKNYTLFLKSDLFLNYIYRNKITQQISDILNKKGWFIYKVIDTKLEKKDWYIVDKRYADPKFLVFVIEPNYTSKVEAEDKIYHISPINPNIILKQGLKPFCGGRGGKNRNIYPPRIYFMTDRDDIGFVAWTLYGDETSKKTLYLYEVNVKKLPLDSKFYIDPTWNGDQAIYTYTSIPPSCITQVEKIGTFEEFENSNLNPY